MLQLEALPNCLDETPEEQAMTMQVGIIGPEGIVIASDKKLSYLGAGVNQTATTEKIIWNDQGTIACGFAGYRTSNAIALAITTLSIDNHPINSSDHAWKRVLYKTASEVTRPSVLNPLDEIIVVRADCMDKFWIVGKTSGHAESVDSVSDRICIGDTGNLGRFWPQFFYRPDLSMDDVRFLAVLTIWWGEKHNPSAIGNGIDLVTCTPSGIQVEKNVEQLIERCKTLEADLTRQFCRHTY